MVNSDKINILDLYNAGDYEQAFQYGLNILIEKNVSKEEQASVALIIALIENNNKNFLKSELYLKYAIELNPKFLVALVQLAGHYFHLLDFKSSRIYCLKALEIQRPYEGLMMLARIEYELGSLNNAMKLLDEIKNNYNLQHDYHSLLGEIHEENEKFDDAIKSYQHAANLAPERTKPKIALSFLYSRLGDYEKGFTLYEERLKENEYTKILNSSTIKYWNGESLANRNIIILCEQGLGDNLQFLRFVHYLSKLEKHKQPDLIYLCVDDALFGLVTNSFSNIENIKVIKSKQEVNANYICYLISLPYIFKIFNPDNFYIGPFLKPTNTHVEKWRKVFQGLFQHKLKVGLLWRGGIAKDNLDQQLKDMHRSINLKEFIPLYKKVSSCNLTHKVEFFSLQNNLTLEEENIIKNDFPLVTMVEETNSFDELAGFIKNLDLVISVSSTTFFLTAGMDIETWMLNRKKTDFRWLHKSKTSPYYPKLHIFNQNVSFDWTKQVNDITMLLIERLNH